MKLVYRYLGYLLVISAFFRLIPIAMGFYLNEPIILFVFSMTLSLLVGWFLIYYFRFTPDERVFFSLKHGLMLSAISFVLLPMMGAISFLPSMNFNFLDAYFESVSGFTTTGLTLYNNLEILPKSLLMWRAITQWLGGIGIVTIFLFIFSRLHHHDNVNLRELENESQKTVKLYQAQGISEKPEGSFKGSLRNILTIYIVYTTLGVFLLRLFGLSIFESTALSFTSISRGGFSVTNTFYDSWEVLLVLELMMLIGATSFVTHNKLLLKKFKAFFTSFEKNLMLLIILITSLLTLIVFPNLKIVLFQLISSFTTTGYSVTDFHFIPEFFVVAIMIGMMIGGTFASTAGGMKIFRIYYLIKTIPWSIRKLISPSRAVIPLKINNENVDEAKLVNIGIFVFTYLFILLCGTIIFMLFGYSFFDSSFQIFSALGTVGLQSMDLLLLNGLLKTVLIIAMLFGRLEIFPILILLKVIFSKKFS
ncbi:hypothetical protein KKA95_00320 [Patescibacteria group bacterium]|nr:hypothetical protein [Patescibacteria group bacterium]